MGNVLKANYPSARCQHCGKVTDIQLSSTYRQLVSILKTQREALKLKEMNLSRIHRAKNGQIQTLHKIIAQLRGLMTSKQLKEAQKISQQMRDELKKSESILTQK